MANEYAVNQADLVAVADAIRSKGGTSEVLMFPGGFVDAVGAIEAGSGIELQIDGTTLNGFAKFELVNDKITRINKLRDTTVTKIDCPNVTYVGDARNNPYLEYFNFENVTEINTDTFISDSALKEVIAPKLTKMGGQHNFNSCTSLTYVQLDVAPSFGWQWNFGKCTALTTVIAPAIETNVGAGTFYGCTALDVLVLGNVNSTSVPQLVDVSAFTNTPMGGINGVYSGHIYVPSALIESYKTATNWATLYANYPEIFQPIEGSEYE